MFQSHEAEPPMEMVIRQDIYEDLKPQGGIRIGVGYNCASGAFPAGWGNSEGSWEGFAAGGTTAVEARGLLGKTRV